MGMKKRTTGARVIGRDTTAAVFIIPLLLSTAVFVSAGNIGAGNLGPDKSAPTNGSAPPPENFTAKWTFMVYLDADNNLEGAGIEDFNEMEMVGSTAEVNIVILFDRAPEYDTSNGDWTGTRIYHVKKDSDPNNLASYTEGVDVWYSENETEMNMGDPQTLVNFTLWAMEHFPAEHYFLDLWDHGGAFWGVCWDDSSGEKGDALNMTELGEALDRITETAGRRLDIVGFDACLMAEAAVMYQIKDYADIGVGSGFTEPGDGWPYTEILGPLVQNPDMSPRDLATLVVDAYIDSYTDREDDPQDSPSVSMAAIDLKKFELAADAISAFGMQMSLGSPITPPAAYYSHLRYIRSRTASYDMANVGPFDITQYCMYDIIDFADRVEQDPTLAFLHDSAYNMEAKIKDAIIKARTNDAKFRYHGLTVYFPSGTQTVYDPRFSQTLFARERYWDEFLVNFGDNRVVSDTPPSAVILEPESPAQVAMGETFSFRGIAWDLQNTLLSVEFRIDNGTWKALQGRENWEADIDTSDLVAGKHVFQVRAFDGRNYSAPVSKEFTVKSSALASYTSPGGVSPLLLAAVLVVLVAVALFVFYRTQHTSFSKKVPFLKKPASPHIPANQPTQVTQVAAGQTSPDNTATSPTPLSKKAEGGGTKD